MPLLSSTTTQTFAMHGVQFTSFASGRSGATNLAAWRADFEPRTPGQAHRMSHEEVLLVLAGELDVEIDDATFTAVAGDAVLVPADATFRVSNNADAPAQAWVTTTRGMTASMAATGEQLSPPWAQ